MLENDIKQYIFVYKLKVVQLLAVLDCRVFAFGALQFRVAEDLFTKPFLTGFSICNYNLESGAGARTSQRGREYLELGVTAVNHIWLLLRGRHNVLSPDGFFETSVRLAFARGI